LLTAEEDSIYATRFNIDLITERLVTVVSHCIHLPELRNLPLGCFGASTGAASALRTAALLPDMVKAVVSRGGRPDMAGAFLQDVEAPTLLIVGSLDTEVITLNEQAYAELYCEKELKIVQGAAHLFEEPGKLDEVANLAVNWFNDHLILNAKITAAK
jgi:pimeloyl-ACP methyl ester carboxylesterase